MAQTYIFLTKLSAVDFTFLNGLKLDYLIFLSLCYFVTINIIYAFKMKD